jgi:response regulator NasT
MPSQYRIALADHDADCLAQSARCLTDAGHEVVFQTDTGGALLDACLKLSPDMVISEIDLKGMDGLVAIKTLLCHRDLPILIVSASANSELLDRVVTLRPLGYLVKPIREQELVAGVALTMEHFKELQRLREEAASTRQALRERKVIERAKGIVMRKRSLDEEAAFQYLQKLARDHRQRIVAVAESIIFAQEALE